MEQKCSNDFYKNSILSSNIDLNVVTSINNNNNNYINKSTKSLSQLLNLLLQSFTSTFSLLYKVNHHHNNNNSLIILNDISNLFIKDKCVFGSYIQYVKNVYQNSSSLANNNNQNQKMIDSSDSSDTLSLINVNRLGLFQNLIKVIENFIINYSSQIQDPILSNMNIMLFVYLSTFDFISHLDTVYGEIEIQLLINLGTLL